MSSFFEININTSAIEIVYKIVIYFILFCIAYFIIYFGLIYFQRCVRHIYVKIWRYIYPQRSATIAPIEVAKETDLPTNNNAVVIEVNIVDAFVYRPYEY